MVRKTPQNQTPLWHCFTFSLKAIFVLVAFLAAYLGLWGARAGQAIETAGGSVAYKHVGTLFPELMLEARLPKCKTVHGVSDNQLRAAAVPSRLLRDSEPDGERLEQAPFLSDLSSGLRVLAQPIRLLENPAVQRELELSEEQHKNVNGAFTHREEQLFGLFRLRREISAEEMKAKVDDINNSALEKITEALNEGQRRRLKEIRLQVLSYWGLSTPEVSETLKLSKQQIEQIEQVLRDVALARRELQQSRSENTEKTKRHLKELQARLIRQIDRVMTEKQQQQWREMLGKRFDLRLLYRKGQGSTIKDLEDRKDRKLPVKGN